MKKMKARSTKLSRLKKILKYVALCGAGLVASLFVAIAILPKPPLLNTVPFSQAIYDKNGVLLRLTLASDGAYRLYSPLAAFPPLLRETTLLHEDQYFYLHPGVNPISLLKAIWKSYVTHQFTMGASTITMQVARLRFGIYSRSFYGKFQQIFRALQLEFYYKKDEILEAYLNLASYGGNIEGVEAASLIYFQKHSAQLTLPEVLTLTVVPQNPSHRSPGLANPENVNQLNVARNRLFDRFVNIHPQELSKKTLLALPMVVHKREELPFYAPHFVDGLLAGEHSAQSRLISTLDLELQKHFEAIVDRYVQNRKNRGIRNAAVLLIHAPSMEVQAAVGSVHFYDTEIDGQVNGTKAKRSPGSTLKPFVYALALDQGLIHPMTLLKDTPKSFGAYNPENFDGRFLGPLHATEALNQSRNIPAVTLSSQLVHPSFYEFLKQAGITQMKEESFYGLSPVLGGLEVTMEELGMLYATIKNDGQLKPLRTLLSDPYSEGVRLLSKEASFLVEQMMQKNLRPQQHLLHEMEMQKIPVAWKTGTSFAYRDAWSVGIVGPYVILVWVGNFNGQGNSEFTGRFAAAPLMFQLIESLDLRAMEEVDVKQKARSLNVTQVEICANSGFLANPYCKNHLKSWFIPGVSPITQDEINREIAIDKKTGLRSCHPERDSVVFETYEFWPSDLQRLFEQAGVPRREPPAFEKECSSVSSGAEGKGPEITSPLAHVRYIKRPSMMVRSGQGRLPLQATSDAGVKTLYWFVNTQFLGQTGVHETLFWDLIPGSFTIRVVDDRGRSDTVQIEVEMSQQ